MKGAFEHYSGLLLKKESILFVSFAHGLLSPLKTLCSCNCWQLLSCFTLYVVTGAILPTPVQ